MTAPVSDPNHATARSSVSWRKDIGPVSNAVLYLAFCLLAATGLALAFRLDDGGATLLGVEKRGWATVHTITALSVLTLVALHLWVNWPWLRATLARLRWRTLVVTLLGLAMLVLALLAPVH
jgi:hypothetical protein